jgi:6-phosphogluconolactonase
MGNDGHTASFFPDATNLNTLLNPNRRSHVDVVYAQSAGEPRLTMTLAAIIPTPLIALQIEGEDKAATLKKALAAGSTLPIKRIIDAAQTPVEIFWAP